MAQTKFGRNYTLTVSGTNFPQPLQVTLPFTIEFDITRNTLTSANVCQIRVYNLSQKNRNALRKNATSYGFPIVSIVLKAGYGTNLPIIFAGNVSQSWSVREGVNFITQLECFDGGFAFVNGQTNLTIPAGTSYQAIIANLIESLPNVSVGAIGNYPGTTPKQITYTGDTIKILNELTGGGFFIDNGVGNALGNHEYTIGISAPPIIDASTGLLETPVLEQNIVRFNMEFEPRLNVGTGCQLNSLTFNNLDTLDSNFTGFYKIVAVKHRGMISQTVCGDAITTGEFFSLQSQTPVGTYGK